MGSKVSIVLSAAFLLVSAPAAMAQYNTAPAPASDQYIQANAPVTNQDVTDQYLQEANAAPVEAPVSTPIVNQTKKTAYTGLWCDNSDVYGGHSPKSLWGQRTFWDNQSSD